MIAAECCVLPILIARTGMRAYVLFLFHACLRVAKLSSCSSQSLAISTEMCQIMSSVISSMADLQMDKSCVPGLSQWV